MQHHNGRYRYAPSDLVEFFESSFAAWMRRLHVEYPDQAQPDPETPEFALLAEQGLRHEHSVCTQLRAAGQQIYEVSYSGDRAALTVAAMQAGHEVIYQGELAHDDFMGIADFLVRVEGPSRLGPYHYEVWEAKCARVAQPAFLLQLCGYADLLEALQGRRPQQVWLVLGDGKPLPFPTKDYFYYYRELKAAFLTWMVGFDPQVLPTPDLGGTYGCWTSHAQAWLTASDHLSRVASITTAQVCKLQAAGLQTLTALAQTALTRVPKLDDAVFARLREQAQLQVASAAAERPVYRVVVPEPQEPRRGLSLLPPASPLDIAFDMEGNPFAEGGLEYLFGVTCVEDAQLHYHDWWAHDAREERQAFENFIDWVSARWRTDPSMHIYHYAAYEVTAVRKLMGHYGTREAEVDTLLRNEVFVDLYPIVRQGLRVGTPDYSLKSLERLYRAGRVGGVQTAGDSLVFYDRWLASRQARRWQESPLLSAIRDYNRDDCESTWQLIEWLRTRQQEAGIVWVPKREAASESTQPLTDEPAAPQSPRQALAEGLLAQIPPLTDIDPAEAERWRLHTLFAHVVEFHRREEKPLWWALFDRHAMTEEELTQDLNCLGNLRRIPASPEKIKQSLGFWYAFDPDQDTKLEAGSRCYFAHDLDLQAEIHQLDREQGRVCLKFGPTKMKQLPGGMPPERLSVIPDEVVRADTIANSLMATVSAWQDTQQLPPALEDFLSRRPPQMTGREGNPLVSPETDLIAAVTEVIAALDQSTLCIQGPPGAGKTTVAAHAILALLQLGKRVGITANSHAAILNLLSKCQELAQGNLTCLKIGGSQESPFFATYPGARHAENLRVALPKIGQIQLIGGTAWVFSDPALRGTLDYLFVDEAGQVSVANLMGMAPAAHNLVLIGDQMQLAQPVQGAHPGESGISVLEYLLQGQATIPADLGVFLGTTWRLHPRLCSFLSDAVYEGRLLPAPHTQHRIVRVPLTAHHVKQEAGLFFVPVAHEGNTQGSDEEVAIIRELAGELVGREFTNERGQVAGRLRLEDILFVAPYNMQVRKLTAALGSQARVGSVDKFQGLEAPVVILSMCASQGDGSPRGVEFLLHKNRLNVALSRAQSLAIVVANPALAQTRARSLSQMALLNLFCRVMYEGRAGGVSL